MSVKCRYLLGSRNRYSLARSSCCSIRKSTRMTQCSGGRLNGAKTAMYDEDNPETITNPLLMPALDFTAWLSGRGIDSIGIPPASPIKRANLLFKLVDAGRINPSEIDNFLREIGLMTPIAEN